MYEQDMKAQAIQRYAGNAASGPTSEIESEVAALSASVDRLGKLRSELSVRLSSVSRGVAPKGEAKSAAPIAVLGSPMGRQLEELRNRIDGISSGVADELSALAV